MSSREDGKVERKMKYSDVKREIERNYQVLIPEYAEMQSEWDIEAWVEQHYITPDEGKNLLDYNRKLYKSKIE